MGKNKNNYAVWSTRIKKQTSNNFKKVGSSINIDKRLYKEDIRGSMVHTDMLYKQKIISLKVKEKILWGLNSCLLYTSPSPRDVEESRMPSSA